jgi:lysophospholipase
MSLRETPANPCPPGAVEHRLVAADGVNLRAARWTPQGAHGTVVILNGRAEYIEKYYETTRDLLDMGFAVATMDWRGQGGSERQLHDPMRAHIDDFGLYERDLRALVDDVLTPHCPRPWIGLCHSMGGAIIMQIAHSGRCPFDRLVLTAPMIAIYGRPEPRTERRLVEIVDALGFGGLYAPGAGGARPYSLYPFEGNVLTSDPARYARLQATLAAWPELGVGGPTIGWAHAAFRLMRRFAEPDFPRAVPTPTLVIASGADRVVDTRCIERFATRLRAGDLITLDGARHEIMIERDIHRDLFLRAFEPYAKGALTAFTSPYPAAM